MLHIYRHTDPPTKRVLEELSLLKSGRDIDINFLKHLKSAFSADDMRRVPSVGGPSLSLLLPATGKQSLSKIMEAKKIHFRGLCFLLKKIVKKVLIKCLKIVCFQ